MKKIRIGFLLVLSITLVTATAVSILAAEDGNTPQGSMSRYVNLSTSGPLGGSWALSTTSVVNTGDIGDVIVSSDGTKWDLSVEGGIGGVEGNGDAGETSNIWKFFEIAMYNPNGSCVVSTDNTGWYDPNGNNWTRDFYSCDDVDETEVNFDIAYKFTPSELVDYLEWLYDNSTVSGDTDDLTFSFPITIYASPQ